MKEPFDLNKLTLHEVQVVHMALRTFLIREEDRYLITVFCKQVESKFEKEQSMGKVKQLIEDAELTRQTYGINMAQGSYGGPKGVWLECGTCRESQVIRGSKPHDSVWATAPLEDIVYVFKKHGWTGRGADMHDARCPKCSVTHPLDSEEPSQDRMPDKYILDNDITLKVISSGDHRYNQDTDNDVLTLDELKNAIEDMISSRSDEINKHTQKMEESNKQIAMLKGDINALIEHRKLLPKE